MQRIAYTFRRGTTYYWRRRLPSPFTMFTWQFSLGVTERKDARPIATRLTAASDEVIPKLSRGEITRAEADEYLGSLIAKAQTSSIGRRAPHNRVGADDARPIGLPAPIVDQDRRKAAGAGNDVFSISTTPDHSDSTGLTLISEYVGRLVSEQAAKKKITEKTAAQTSQALALFIEATGVTTLSGITQRDIKRFTNVMKSLPTNYRKGVSDRDKSLEQIIYEASVSESRGAARKVPKIGLSATTINRNLSFISKVLRYAKADGEDVNLRLDPALLREDKSTLERDERPPFDKTDIERLFLHPVWVGHKSILRRNRPGDLIVQDALYWIPLLAVYSGARLEELAGLTVDDLVLDHDIPHIRIMVTENRRLKNLQSRRLIPLHPTLLILEFPKYVRGIKRSGKTDVFPDATPMGKGSFGELIDAPFRKIVDQQLGADAWVDGRKKTFHSLRHYVINNLPKKLHEEYGTLQDVVGHLKPGVTSKVYLSEANLDLKLEALKALPVIQAHLAIPANARRCTTIIGRGGR